MTNNAWTLIKHVAGSVNKAASNIDKAIYNPEPSWLDLHPILSILIGVGIVAIFIITLILSTNDSNSSSPKWWWFIP